MSCNNSIYFSAIVDIAPCSNPVTKTGEFPKRGRPGVIADQSKSKGHRYDVQSHSIPDSTQMDPEHVWGDEGPIND